MTIGLVLAEIVIHVITSLTGPGAYLGKQVDNGLQTAARWLNSRGGTPIRLIVHDDQSQPQVAVQILSQLAAAGVSVVVGPSDRAKCLALDPLIAKSGPVDYCLSPTLHRAESSSYMFVPSVDTVDVDRAMVRYARLRGWRRIALITSTDATGNDAARAFGALVQDPENRGMTLVTDLKFDTASISVAAQLAQIKAAKPDVIFAWSTGAAIGTVLRGLAEQGNELAVATSYGNMVSSLMDNWAPYLPKELLFPSPPWSGNASSPGLDARVKAAQAAMHAAFGAGVETDAGAGISWDALSIVAAALRTLGPNPTADQIRDAIDRVHGFAGINGVYDFLRYPQRGLGEENAVITRWNPARREWTIVSRSAGIPIDATPQRSGR